MFIRRFALLLLALLVVLPATGASAGNGVRTKVIMSLKLPAFHGKLKSKSHACLKGRRVELFRKRQGRDRRLGSDRTNRRGRWSIPLGKRLKSGAAYYAKVKRKGRCQPGRSKALTIG